MPQILDHPYRILIVGASGSGKINALLNLINPKLDIEKTYLYAKVLYESKHHILINKRKIADIKRFMILKILFNTHTIWMIFIIILKNKIQIKNKKYESYLMR